MHHRGGGVLKTAGRDSAEEDAVVAGVLVLCGFAFEEAQGVAEQGKALGRTLDGHPFKSVGAGSKAAGEVGQQLTRPHALAQLRPALRDVGEQRQRGEIALHRVLDVRALDLDDDRFPGTQSGAVGLADRRCGERFGVELGEHLPHRPAELGDQHRLDALERLRRDLVLEGDQPVRFKVRLGGGTDRVDYVVSCLVVTEADRQKEVEFKIKERDQ